MAVPPAEDAPFLDAIIAAPEDDAPRLVYADHLLESDDPKRREHGEYIVAACAVARLPRRSEAWRRAKDRQLALQPASGANVFAWSRGFPSGVNVWPSFLRDAHGLMRRIPFERLALHPRPGQPLRATLGDLAWAAKRFPRLGALVIDNDSSAATLDPRRLDSRPEDDKTIAWPTGELPHPSLVEAIIELRLEWELPVWLREPLPARTRLALRGSDAGAMRVMSDRPLTSLTWRATDDARFARPPIGAGLETLVATNVRFDGALADAVASAHLARLELLHEGSSPARLAPGSYTKLESLRLGHFAIDASFGAVSLPALSELELTDCVVDREGTNVLVTHPDLGPLHRPKFLRCTLADPAALRTCWTDVVVA